MLLVTQTISGCTDISVSGGCRGSQAVLNPKAHTSLNGRHVTSRVSHRQSMRYTGCSSGCLRSGAKHRMLRWQSRVSFVRIERPVFD